MNTGLTRRSFLRFILTGASLVLAAFAVRFGSAPPDLGSTRPGGDEPPDGDSGRRPAADRHTESLQARASLRRASVIPTRPFDERELYGPHDLAG